MNDAPFETLSAAELHAMLFEGVSLHLFDANGDDFRRDEGILPGARLLSSFDRYDPGQELPVDRSEKVVFYCAYEACTASHSAAKRAIEAGYSDVSVMIDGVKGWKAAGYAVSSTPR